MPETFETVAKDRRVVAMVNVMPVPVLCDQGRVALALGDQAKTIC